MIFLSALTYYVARTLDSAEKNLGLATNFQFSYTWGRLSLGDFVLAGMILVGLRPGKSEPGPTQPVSVGSVTPLESFANFM